MIIKKIPEIPISCISLETGTLVFALFNIVVTALATLLSLGALIYSSIIMIFFIKDANKPTESTGLATVLLLFQMIGCLLLVIASGTALVLSAFLVNGALKRKPEHIKAYFVYGVVVDVLSTLATVAFLNIAIDQTSGYRTHYALWITVGCFIALLIYTFILVMIRQTYRNLERINAQFGHEKLVEAPEKC